MFFLDRACVRHSLTENTQKLMYRFKLWSESENVKYLHPIKKFSKEEIN